VQRFIQHFGCAVYPLAITLAQGTTEAFDCGDDFLAIRAAEEIVLVAKVLATMPQ
jgi:hypothetical protein